MLVGFVGSHRVGKSTTAEEWARRHGFNYVPFSVSGVIKSFGHSSEEEVSFERRLQIQQAVLDTYIEQFSGLDKKGVFVTDRTPLDFYAYMMADILRASIPSDNPSLQSKTLAYFENCKSSMWSDALDLKHACFINPAIELVHDAKSANCPVYQLHIHHLTHDVFKKLAQPALCNYIQIPTRTVELNARLDYIDFRWEGLVNKHGKHN